MSAVCYARLCWRDYVEHRWMRKVVAAGLGLELISIVVYGAMTSGGGSL